MGHMQVICQGTSLNTGLSERCTHRVRGDGMHFRRYCAEANIAGQV
jgi:hypothetical protein